MKTKGQQKATESSPAYHPCSFFPVKRTCPRCNLGSCPRSRGEATDISCSLKPMIIRSNLRRSKLAEKGPPRWRNRGPFGLPKPKKRVPPNKEDKLKSQRDHNNQRRPRAINQTVPRVQKFTTRNLLTRQNGGRISKMGGGGGGGCWCSMCFPLNQPQKGDPQKTRTHNNQYLPREYKNGTHSEQQHVICKTTLPPTTTAFVGGYPKDQFPL